MYSRNEVYMVSDLDVLDSQIRQQHVNVKVWKEGLDREKKKLTEMISLRNEAKKCLELKDVSQE